MNLAIRRCRARLISGRISSELLCIGHVDHAFRCEISRIRVSRFKSEFERGAVDIQHPLDRQGLAAAATANPIGLIVGGAVKVGGEVSGSGTIEGSAKRTAAEIADELKVAFEKQGWI